MEESTVEIQVNGDLRAVRAGASLPELLHELGVPPQAVLVEHNGVALFRKEWGTIQLAAGDRLEIIRVVAGG